ERLLGAARAHPAARRVLADPGYRQRLAQAHIEVELLRLVGYRSLTRLLRTGQPGVESSIEKVLGSETDQRLQELAMEVLGPWAARRAAPGSGHGMAPRDRTLDPRNGLDPRARPVLVHRRRPRVDQPRLALRGGGRAPRAYGWPAALRDDLRAGLRFPPRPRLPPRAAHGCGPGAGARAHGGRLSGPPVARDRAPAHRDLRALRARPRAAGRLPERAPGGARALVAPAARGGVGERARRLLRRL